MISFQEVNINFGTQDVLSGVSFKINQGERCGITGPNGAGKSTIFNLISEEISPQRGHVVFEGTKPTVGHLHQQLSKWNHDDTLLSYTLRASRRLRELEHQIHTIEKELPTDPQERNQALNRLGDLQTEFEHLGGYDIESRVKEALCGLGFKPDELERPFAEFSGGWKMRAEMIRTLVTEPDLLMLDEPSNYLDLPAVEWLQHYLRNYQGTLLLISHDRYLLRSLTNVTLEVDGQTVTRYNGGYDFYLKERTQRHEALVAARRNQDRLREQTQRFIDTFRYTPTKAAQVQSRIKMLEKMEEIVVPREATTAGKIRLPEFQHSGTTALNIKDVGFSYDGSHWVFRNVSFQVGRGEQLALVGFNGMGKTTLSRLFSKVLDPTEGEIILGHKVVPGYVSQDISETIPPERSLINAVRMEDGTLTEATARNLLGSFGFSGDDAFKTAGVLSGGEKIRLAFARIYAAKANLLILDEPTTHLDINGRRALEEELVKYEGTVIIVSHDVEFVRTVAHNIIEVSNGNVRKFLGGYDDFLAFQNKRTAPDPSLQQTSSGIKTEPTDNSSKTVNDKKVLSRKEIRRQRAMEREKIKPLINSLKRRVAASEKRIIQLEEEQGQLVERLSLEGDDKPDFESINRRLSEIQKELESVNTLWEQAASELAFLEAE